MGLISHFTARKLFKSTKRICNKLKARLMQAVIVNLQMMNTRDSDRESYLWRQVRTQTQRTSYHGTCEPPLLSQPMFQSLSEWSCRHQLCFRLSFGSGLTRHITLDSIMAIEMLPHLKQMATCSKLI